MICKADLHSAGDSCGECKTCTKMKWISVKERLPDEERIVILVLCPNGMHVARFHDGIDQPGIVGGWESCNYCGGENRVTFGIPERWEQLITHWMPLPEIPKCF